MKNKKIKDFAVDVSFSVICVALFFLFTVLFYRQAVNDQGHYASDLPAHISFAMNGRGYSLMYIIIGILMRTTGREWSVAVFESMCLLGTWRITYQIMKKTAEDGQKKEKLFFISLGMLFLTSIFLPGIYGQFYTGSLITQPWHNITYFGMRFFALMTMDVFFRVYESYLDGFSGTQWFVIAVLLAFSTAVKPNFFIAFAFTLLIGLVLDFTKTFFQMPAFGNMVKMGMVVFPSCLILLCQAFILYRPKDHGETSGIVLLWGSQFLAKGMDRILFMFLCGLSFPAIVYIYNRKQLKKSEKFVYLLYMVTFLQAIMLGETGPRAGDGNFAWGLYGSAYLLFICTVSLFLKNEKETDGSFTARFYLGFGKLLLCLHLITGMVYFLHILKGGGYGI